MSALPPFRPDSSFRLSAALRARVAPLLDADAVESFLSALPPEQRAEAAEPFLVTGGAGNHALPQVQPTGDPDWDRALGRIYAPLRERWRKQGAVQAWDTAEGPVPFWHPGWDG